MTRDGSQPSDPSKRAFLGTMATTAASVLVGCGPPPPKPPAPPKTTPTIAPPQKAPAIIVSEGARPQLPCGVQSGDVSGGNAIVWSKADRPSRMKVEWSTRESFADRSHVMGPLVSSTSDFTGKVELRDLPRGQTIFYRVSFLDPNEDAIASQPVAGRFRTSADQGSLRDTLFAFSGDTCGQGWGIDVDRGGLLTYESIRALGPDLFLHAGDLIYADNPIRPHVRLDDGTFWNNIVTPAKSKVAETLDEFRGNFAYNFLDQHVRRFSSEVPTVVMWDDHEVHNDWYPGLSLAPDERYKVVDATLLSSFARQAMDEYTPIATARYGGRIYRAIDQGPLLEVFALDARTYRGHNSPNRQHVVSAESRYLGEDQIAWLKTSLAKSTATWKVIATDTPLALVVAGRRKKNGIPMDSWANGPGPPMGRELELASILSFIKTTHIENVVWITADVHYAAAHHFHPSRAAFRNFTPFWEFVSGPLHAGNFGPNQLDMTFGPREVFRTTPVDSRPNRPPQETNQYFTTMHIDARSRNMSVVIRSRSGKAVYTQVLEPAGY